MTRSAAALARQQLKATEERNSADPPWETLEKWAPGETSLWMISELVAGLAAEVSQRLASLARDAAIRRIRDGRFSRAASTEADQTGTAQQDPEPTRGSPTTSSSPIRSVTATPPTPSTGPSGAQETESASADTGEEDSSTAATSTTKNVEHFPSDQIIQGMATGMFAQPPLDRDGDNYVIISPRPPALHLLQTRQRCPITTSGGPACSMVCEAGASQQLPLRAALTTSIPTLLQQVAPPTVSLPTIPVQPQSLPQRWWETAEGIVSTTSGHQLPPLAPTNPYPQLYQSGTALYTMTPVQTPVGLVPAATMSTSSEGMLRHPGNPLLQPPKLTPMPMQLMLGNQEVQLPSQDPAQQTS